MYESCGQSECLMNMPTIKTNMEPHNHHNTGCNFDVAIICITTLLMKVYLTNNSSKCTLKGLCWQGLIVLLKMCGKCRFIVSGTGSFDCLFICFPPLFFLLNNTANLLGHGKISILTTCLYYASVLNIF